MRDNFVPVYKSGVFRKFVEINFCSLWSHGLVFDSRSLIGVVDSL